MRTMRRAGLWLGLSSLALVGACSSETESGGGGSSPTTTTTVTTTTGSGGSGNEGGSTGGSAATGGTTTTTSSGGSGNEGGSTGGSSSGGGGSSSGGGGSGGVSGTGHDQCDAELVSEGLHQGTFEGFANDYEAVTACVGIDEPGPDIAYAIEVPDGELLTAIVFPASDDAAIYAVTDCSDLSTCVAGTDEYTEGGSESLQWTNETGQSQTVYVIVDSEITTSDSTYELRLHVGEEHTCDDLFDNDLDDAVDCADPTGCQGSAACTPGAGATGTACTANTDCAAVGGDPSCITLTGWWNGYCSDWCDTASPNCAGDGVCIDAGAGGMCFDGCDTSADCLADYLCEGFSAGNSCWPDLASCMQAATAQLGDNAGDTSGGPEGFESSCGGLGLEDGFIFTPGASGTLTVTLTSATDQGFAVYADECTWAQEETCVDDQAGGTPETDQIAVTANVPYYIVVKAYDPGEEGPFTLNLALN